MSKLLMLDVGLYLRECALDVSEWILDAPEKFISRGALAEMFVGLELKKNGTPLMEEKKIAQALRVSEENFSTLGDVKILPIYLVGQWQKFM